MADEAFALGGELRSPTSTSAKILDAATGVNANAIYPDTDSRPGVRRFRAGGRRRTDLDRRARSPCDLGDKDHRPAHRRPRPGPAVPGTPDPVKDADEVVAFFKEYAASSRDQGRLRRRQPA